ncbi:hypothetical protein C5C31_01780 [Rathayibacter rathayi]|nr:hypothetical protein C5C31_01780 [Rathayibacter rathayi]
MHFGIRQRLTVTHPDGSMGLRGVSATARRSGRGAKEKFSPSFTARFRREGIQMHNTSEQSFPVLFRTLADGGFGESALTFEPLTSDGRSGVEIHHLYTAAETGGSAAAVARYLPGATAKTHRHSGHELIYVVSGELETEAGRYPAGSLLSLSPGSVHTPRSPLGCLALVVWEKPVQPL